MDDVKEMMLSLKSLDTESDYNFWDKFWKQLEDSLLEMPIEDQIQLMKEQVYDIYDPEDWSVPLSCFAKQLSPREVTQEEVENFFRILLDHIMTMGSDISDDILCYISIPEKRAQEICIEVPGFANEPEVMDDICSLVGNDSEYKRSLVKIQSR